MSTLQTRLQDTLGAEHLASIPLGISEEVHALALSDNELNYISADIAGQEHLARSIERDMENAEDRLDSIDDNLSGLEAMIAGLDEWNPGLAMKMYQDARKLTVRTTGESEDIAVVAGIESFSDDATAKLEIFNGMESIKEKAVNIGKSIIEFFKNLYKSVIAAFVGLFDRFRGIEQRCDILTSRLDKLSDDQIKETIQLGKWNAFLDVQGGINPINNIINLTKIVNKLGEALNEQKGERAVELVANMLIEFTRYTTANRIKFVAKDYTSRVGSIAYIEFEWSAPKNIFGIRHSKFSYKIADNAPISGEYGTTLKKVALLSLTKKIKGMAGEAKNKKFSASSLSTFRDKAINTLKRFSVSGKDRREARLLRDTHIASNKFSRALMRYEGDVLIAGQQFIAAHI